VKSQNTEGELVSKAAKAMINAYAPYSGFSVGAAVLSNKGRIFTGANVENASYGATICAERSAVTSAVSAGHRKLKAVAVVADSPEPVPPCGACLQVLSEFCDSNLLIICATAQTPEKNIRYRLKELLPKRFKLRQ